MFMVDKTTFQRAREFEKECQANIKPSQDKRFKALKAKMMRRLRRQESRAKRAGGKPSETAVRPQAFSCVTRAEEDREFIM